MKRFLPFIILFLLSDFLLLAQEKRFFMASEFKHAYDNQTRSWDGKPGVNYWQNTVDYTIEIKVDPTTRLINGSEKIQYHNNSPKALNTIVVRLYYDAYGKGKGRDEDLETLEDLTDGVDITRLMINEKLFDINSRSIRRFETNMNILLDTPLLSGETLSMEIDWSNYIPYSSNRTGRYDSTSFFVAYFYPQISVYDDVFGWDNLSYGGITEFYNNLANFDVTISVPPEFTIWATGELQNAKKVLNKKIYKRFKEALQSPEVVQVINSDDLDEVLKHSMEPWHFKAIEVSDFAFGLSDHFAWDAAIQNVEGRNILINSAFPVNRADQCRQLTAIQQKTIKHFSEDVPGVPYPYPVFTTFIGAAGGGMEFPMMANNAGPGRSLTVHEMFHTYFPMYVRTNEKKFAWMDEGWANLITETVINTYFNNQPDTGIVYRTSLSRNTGSYSDLPLITSSQFTDRSNYGYSAYSLPAFIYGVLHHILGPDLFHKCLKEYILRWAKKSPTPYDFFYTFEDISGQDLAWIWKPWFFEFGYPDLRIAKMEDGHLTIEKIGIKPLPISINVKYDNDSTKEILVNASVWMNNDVCTIPIENPESVARIFVNNDLPDLTPQDNVYPSIAEFYKTVTIDTDFEGSYLRPGRYPLNLNVEYRKGILVINSRWSGDTYLIPESQYEYASFDGSIKVRFVKENEKVISMVIRMWGRDMKADKL